MRCSDASAYTRDLAVRLVRYAMKKNIRKRPFSFGRKDFSISRRGAWGQVTIASILITILPAMVLAWIWQNHLAGTPLPAAALWGACSGGVIVILLGYTLLLKYPVSIVRLRSYLNTLVDGGIPTLMHLSDDEDDLAAVQRYMDEIVKMAEERVRMIKAQYEGKLESERQRVMVESIGAMCHHLGQPATVMSMCFYRLKSNPGSTEIPEILAECETSFNAMTEILDKLRVTAHYCTESYLHPSAEPSDKQEDRIIKS